MFWSSSVLVKVQAFPGFGNLLHQHQPTFLLLFVASVPHDQEGLTEIGGLAGVIEAQHGLHAVFSACPFFVEGTLT